MGKADGSDTITIHAASAKAGALYIERGATLYMYNGVHINQTGVEASVDALVTGPTATCMAVKLQIVNHIITLPPSA